MDDSTIGFEAGTLAHAIEERTRRSLAGGAMQPIETVEESLEDGGVRFIVRRVSSLARKENEAARRARDASTARDPFLPYDHDLFVAEISGTHVALLNKFNVIDGHLLIVTRRYADQETLIDRGDFAALAACMREFEGLGFYNGGRQAGASQPHKHLQLVPLPLSRDGPPVPVESLLDAVRDARGILGVPALPFRHAFSWIDSRWFDDVGIAARHLRSVYLGLLGAAGLRGVGAGGESRQSAPYNLLLTRRWMLLVPRAREQFDSISVNALGFAGSLFLRDDEQLEAVKLAGPMQVLKTVAVSAG